ncbi:MAG: branched-chain amino acid transaminase [Spirochaetota bacterium]
MASTVEKFSYFQGKIVPAEDANINIETHGFQYGTGVFGGLRGYYNADFDNVFLFRIYDHFKRLLNSVKIMQLNFQATPEELVDITLELVQKNQRKENIYIRPIVYTSALELSPRFHQVPADIAIYILALNDYLDTKRGLRTRISSWRRINDVAIPTLSKASGGYINSALAKSEALIDGYDEAIFLDDRGFVSEGSAENLFIVRDGTILTPPIHSSILEGITRRSIIQLARDLGYTVVERDISRSELYICDEAFFSGTGVQVAWIKEIDNRTVGNGEMGSITAKLQKLFFDIVRNKEEKYSSWLTGAY